MHTQAPPVLPGSVRHADGSALPSEPALPRLCPHRVHSVLLRNCPGPSLPTDSPVSSSKVTAGVPAQGTGRVRSLRKGRKALLSSAVTVKVPEPGGLRPTIQGRGPDAGSAQPEQCPANLALHAAPRQPAEVMVVCPQLASQGGSARPLVLFSGWGRAWLEGARGSVSLRTWGTRAWVPPFPNTALCT